MASDKFVISKLRQVLERHKGKSWQELSDAIYRIGGATRDVRIRRQLLAQICSEDFGEVKLSVTQWIALDKFCVAKGEGPLFARTDSLVDAIAESWEVGFYMAGLYQHADAVSACDMRAIRTLLQTRLTRMEVKILDVVDEDDWKAASAGCDARANVVIGSPVGCLAADRMMSKMLGYDVTSKTLVERLPFFIVRRSGERGLKSGFVRGRVAAVNRDPEAAEQISDDQRALVVENHVFVSTDQVDYSLLLAQRSPETGQVRVVLGGLTGVATQELARILQDGNPPFDLPQPKGPKAKGQPPIMAFVYKHTLDGKRRMTKKGRGSVQNKARERVSVAGSVPALGPVVLHQVEGEWRTL